MRSQLPDGFIWGSATAAHQVEGGNWNNDWWEWEHAPSTVCLEPSGDACDQFHLYEADTRMLAGLGFNAYRFSVEWSRLEPEENEWSTAAEDHYLRLCESCVEAGLTPIVTFHHFTSPRWLARSGGWADPDTAERFASFCERATARLGAAIGGACTINEPNIVAVMGYLFGIFPPGAQDPGLRLKVNDTFIRAHRLAYQAIKAGPGSFPVGLTVSMSDWQASATEEELKGDFDGLGGQEAAEKQLSKLRSEMEDEFLAGAAGDDFIGVQCYSRSRVGPKGMLGPESGVGVTQMGYEFWPQCLEATIRRAWEVTDHTPILVTENGIGTDNDDERIDYVRQALEGMGRCIDDGIDVRGYIHWSLLDNFEWILGYGPKFGLVQVERTSPFARRPKPSATWLGNQARSNKIAG